jgi:hypothetical protein
VHAFAQGSGDNEVVFLIKFKSPPAGKQTQQQWQGCFKSNGWESFALSATLADLHVIGAPPPPPSLHQNWLPTTLCNVHSPWVLQRLMVARTWITVIIIVVIFECELIGGLSLLFGHPWAT